MSQLTALIATNCALLTQGRSAMTADGGALYQNDPAATHSQVGSHFRHVLDHYTSFLTGWASGRIDYDARARDAGLETDPELAGAAAQQVIEQLEQLISAPLGRVLHVNVAVATEGHGQAEWAASTLARELAFLLSHTVHHYALIALCARLRGIDLGEEFGVAPSTLEYRSSQLAVSH
ncbi:MAG: DinB family protein [Gemmatimonadota bacterium]